MRIPGMPVALVVGLAACGAEQSPPPDHQPAIVARAIENEPPVAAASPPGDELDDTPVEAPAQLPSLEVVGSPGALGLEALDVKVTVLGRLARTEVTQVFRNALPRVVEGSYRMTLPDAAVISRLAMDVDGVLTEGELAEKERARRIYDDIVRAQKDPALLEWQGGNRFTMQVFPIPASGTKTIVLAYEELLPVRGRRVQYAYGLPALADGRSSRIARFSFTLAATDAGTPALERDGAAYPARSDDHGVWYEDVDFVPRGSLRVSFPRPEPGSATVVTGGIGDGDDAGQAFLVDVVPELPPATRPPPRDLVLALDSSRGIGDRELARAAEVARRVAARRAGARVVMVIGDVDVSTCSAGTAACLDGLQAGGATDLEALLGAAAQAATGLEHPAIVLLSDGVATVGELDGDVLRERFLEQLDAERTAVFTVAVGHEPDVDFLAELANGGRGHPLRLTPAGSVDGAVESLVHLLSVPLLLDVTAEVIEGDAELVERAPVHLRPGEPLAVLGRGTGSPFTLALRGRWNDEDVETEVRVEPSTTSAERLVPHFWARAAIEALERRGAPRQEMVALSLRHGVMSKATSFLVLENEQAFRRFGVERSRHAELAADGKKNLEKGTGPLQALLGAKGDTKHDAPALPAELWASPSTNSDVTALQGLVVNGQGLGLRGVGGGGGATGTTTLGSGKMGTRGRGAGEAGYGSGAGGLGGRGKHDVAMTQGSPIILGSLDKELIRRVVQTHLAQIKYCYERELLRTPGLFGRVVMKWVINGEGVVTQAQTAETQLRNANVESCIATRIKTWRFPKPGGGGIVIVNYPFVSKQSDGERDVSAPPQRAPEPPPPPAPPPRRRTLVDVLAERRGNLLDVQLLLEEVRWRGSLGDDRGARRALSEVVELAPHDPDRRQLYADELLRRGQLTQACEELGHVTTLQPSRRELFRTMMGLRRRGGADASALKSCIVDGVSRLPVQRALSLVLTWEDSSADVDLHVIAPTGEHVFFQHREGKDGGLLYYDVTDGYGPEIYTLGQASKGRYRLGVVHYRGPEAGVRGTLTIIEDAGTPAERRRYLPFRLGAADPDDVRTLAEVRL